MSANGAADEPTVEQGYERLKTRVGTQLETLLGLEVAQTSEVAADNQYLHPIYRTFQQAVIECLLTALDHLRFLAWSLQNRNEPFPYAQFTVIRTAITAASTALWMLSGSNADERRIRALEFYLKDFKSNASWIDTVKKQPQLQNLSPADQIRADAERAVLDTRQDLLVQMANSLLNPQPPFTRQTLERTSDTKMVTIAGSETAALGSGGFDPGVTLLNTWQTMSGYARARPWAALPGKHPEGEIDPVTGMQKITQKGDPHALLDAAFRGLLVVEQAVGRLVGLSAAP
ncbi:hypothetical protein MNAB215_5843 [Mycobacterium numidiamassiliense]|uniref:Uncharacterized protein n=1 Tax=Mycobacterium numidiamassiliense TaxID=1841861 RepID=A0A2U3PIM1_9MYCO|nr:hypothetical protein [Mycobacterium numidiamassiliense]SPM43617.1 hypothetical protein MNAB215_5843 [Mycobacterium numidiamassiliense]